jgi:hypothetical protein
MARETLSEVKAQRDALARRVEELVESKIRLLSALTVAKRILDDALDRDA